ncbi:MAG: extracellular solute-binding protein [Eubacterium sp.]|nr:extracellular solute-binding protein [Eubacterium sp.]
MLNKKFKIFKGERLKRDLCIACAGVMMLGTSGCGKKEETSRPSSSASDNNAESTESKMIEAKAVQEGTTFAETEIKYKKDSDMFVDAIVQGEILFTLIQEDCSKQQKDIEPELERLVDNIYTFNVNTGVCKKITDYKPEDSIDLYSLCSNPDGEIYVIKYDNINETQKLCKIEDGTLVEQFDLEVLDYNSEDPYYLWLIDKNGNLYTKNQSGIKIYDKDMNEVFSEEFPGSTIRASANTKNGNIVVCLKSDVENSQQNTIIIYDPDSYKKIKEIEVEKTLASSALFTGVGNYDFLYGTSSELFGYDIASGSSTKIIDYDSTGIDIVNGYGPYMIDENTFIYGRDEEGENPFGNGFTLTKYTNLDVSDNSAAKIITYAARYQDAKIKQDIMEYNSSQSEYRIKIVDYSEESDPDAKLNADIAAGNYPDIYEIYEGLGDVSLGQGIEAGLFENLTPYIEEDEDVNLEDLIPAVRTAIDIKGQYFFLPSSFRLYTLVGRGSEIGMEPGWSYSEMKDYYFSSPDAHLFTSENKTDILNVLLQGCSYDFIDVRRGTSYFDNRAFKDILEMADSGKDEKSDLEEATLMEAQDLAENKRLFKEGSISLDDMVTLDEIYKGDYFIKGFPSTDNSGTFVELPGMVAISSHSKNKEAAWEFIKRYISEDYQGKHYQYFNGDPTRTDVFNVKCKALKATKDTKDKYGNTVFPLELSYKWGEYEINRRPIQMKI